MEKKMNNNGESFKNNVENALGNLASRFEFYDDYCEVTYPTGLLDDEKFYYEPNENGKYIINYDGIENKFDSLQDAVEQLQLWAEGEPVTGDALFGTISEIAPEVESLYLNETTRLWKATMYEVDVDGECVPFIFNDDGTEFMPKDWHSYWNGEIEDTDWVTTDGRECVIVDGQPQIAI